MAGLLSGFTESMNGAGPLGGRVTNWLQDNPYTALMLGMGLLSGQGTSDAFGKGVQGLLTGSQYDTQRKTLAEQQKALGGLFTGHWGQGLAGAKPAIAAPSGTRELFKAFPDLGGKIALDKLVPTVNANQSTSYNDYLAAKKEGSFKGTFTDWQEKYGTNRSAEDWGLTPQPIIDNNSGAVTGLVRLSNRGGIQWLDSQFRPVGPVYHPGDAGYDQAASAVQNSAGAAQPQSAPVAPGGAFPNLGGSYSPPGSVKVVGQGTQQTLVGPTGAPRGEPLPVFNTQEAADKSAGVDQATDLKTANNASLKATSQKNSIALMRRAAEDPNFYSGALADQVLAVKKLGVALGMDPNTAAGMENFQSMSNQLVKDRLGSLGTGVSNADVNFIGRTVPTLDATPQGNKQLLDILEKLADRDIEVAQVAQQYAKDHGGGTRLDQNWSSYLADWAKTHPLFDSGGGSRSVDDLVKQYAP